MNWFDIAILLTVLLFAVIGVVRGFIREILSLISWILAFWLAFTYAESASGLLAGYIDQPLLRVIAAFAGLFIAALLVLTIVSSLMHKLLSFSGIKATDRALGGIFGAFKAVVIVTALMLVARYTVLPEEPSRAEWWRDSLLAVHFKPAVNILHEVLPADIARFLGAAKSTG